MIVYNYQKVANDYFTPSANAIVRVNGYAVVVGSITVRDKKLYDAQTDVPSVCGFI